MSDLSNVGYSRYAPPRLTRNEAEARSLVAQRLQRREFLLGDAAWEFSMQPLATGTELAFGNNDWQVRGEWGGAPFELRLPAATADQWLRARFVSMQLPELPADLRAAAFESALEDLFELLSGLGRGQARIDAVDEALPNPESVLAHHFSVAITREGSPVWAKLSTDSFGLVLMAELASAWPPERGPLKADDVQVVLQAEVGCATLSRAELRSLKHGDAVLLQEVWFTQRGELALRHGNWSLGVRSEGAHLVVTQAFHSPEARMNDPAEEEGVTAHEDGPVDLEELPVRVHFDLGQRSMTLAEIVELQVGQVLELSRPLSQAVSIRVNGALVGTGELLEIGGRIAVGITSLGQKREAAQ